MVINGTIFEGWEPNKERNVTSYVRPLEDTILLDPLPCRINPKNPLDRIEMLILQHSAPKNFEARMANRFTWMKFARRFLKKFLTFINVWASSFY